MDKLKISSLTFVNLYKIQFHNVSNIKKPLIKEAFKNDKLPNI